MSIDSTSEVWSQLGLTRTDDKKQQAADEVGQEQFLKLMLAQMQNQDPMKPMENGEFLTQIAQFSSAKGIADMSESLQGLSTSLTSNQALQASSMIGRTVLSPSDTGFLDAQGGGMGGMIDMPNSTNNLTIRIQDANGADVKVIPMGQQQSGPVYFAWDGLDEAGTAYPPGSYKVIAEAEVDGQNKAVETLMASRVESVSIGKAGQGITLNVTGLGSVSMSDVREIM